jgi:hypothetical protein
MISFRAIQIKKKKEREIKHCLGII